MNDLFVFLDRKHEKNQSNIDKIDFLIGGEPILIIDIFYKPLNNHHLFSLLTTYHIEKLICRGVGENFRFLTSIILIWRTVDHRRRKVR